MGANCGAPDCAACGEHIWADARKHNWSGVVVEPLQESFSKLAANYADRPNVRPLQFAISSFDGPMTFYAPVGDGFPTEWASLRQLCSQPPHLPQSLVDCCLLLVRGRKSTTCAPVPCSLKHSMLGRTDLVRKQDIRQVEVSALSLSTLWQRHIVSNTERVDILLLDLEGHDHEVIMATNFSELRPQPKYILYEHAHIPISLKSIVLEHLRMGGYRVLREVYSNSQCGYSHLDNLMEFIGT